MGRRPTKRRTEIVTLARERMTSIGYDATTIGDLANELGFSKAAIAYYFPTKDAFLDEFIGPFLDDLDAATLDHADPVEALGAYLDVIIANHDVAVWLDTDPAILNHPVHRARLDEINGRVMDLITGRSRKGADRMRALAVLGGIWRPARETTADELTVHAPAIIDAALASF